MRLVLISDTHSRHRLIGKVPEGDVLVFAGDLMTSGKEAGEVFDFNDWLGGLPHKHKIVIAGNHDWLFQLQPGFARSLLTNATYLEHSGCEIDGIRFWGAPVQPEFGGWAFNVERGAAIRRYWDMIPAGTDVLITHGPPMGQCDKTHPMSYEHIGCEELAIAVDRIRPQLHVFGHIHGGAGQTYKDSTRFVNASFLNEAYRPAYGPTVVDIQPRRSRS